MICPEVLAPLLKRAELWNKVAECTALILLSLVDGWRAVAILWEGQGVPSLYFFRINGTSSCGTLCFLEVVAWVSIVEWTNLTEMNMTRERGPGKEGQGGASPLWEPQASSEQGRLSGRLGSKGIQEGLAINLAVSPGATGQKLDRRLHSEESLKVSIRNNLELVRIGSHHQQAKEFSFEGVFQLFLMKLKASKFYWIESFLRISI